MKTPLLKLIENIENDHIGGQAYYASRGEGHNGENYENKKEHPNNKYFSKPILEFLSKRGFSLYVTGHISYLKNMGIAPVQMLKDRWNRADNMRKEGTTHTALFHPSFSHFIIPAVAISVAKTCSKMCGILKKVYEKSVQLMTYKTFSRKEKLNATATARVNGLIRFFSAKNKMRTADSFRDSSTNPPSIFPAASFIDASIKYAFPTISTPKNIARAIYKRFLTEIELSKFMVMLSSNATTFKPNNQFI